MKPRSRELQPNDCCILNGGRGAWAFEPLAVELARHLGIDVSTTPRRFNYLLFAEDLGLATDATFVPYDSIRMAADKRLLATAFQEAAVPIPRTRLFDTFDQVTRFLRQNRAREWCLKYPIGCGGHGHRILSETDAEPAKWPRPFVVQEFIAMERPEVFRTYGAGGRIFGWLARRFPDNAASSPWVAHARGARYLNLHHPPALDAQAAEKALVATGLLDSFGCVDLLQNVDGQWLVLEVGTDGVFNQVDRDLGDLEFQAELNARVGESFWRAAKRIDRA